MQSHDCNKGEFLQTLGYVRISNPEKQDPASQVKLMQERGIDIDNIYIDMVSGGVAPSDRVAFKKLKERISNGDISELVISEYSRIGRDMIESLSEVLSLLKLNIRIQSLSEREKMINQYPTVTMQLFAVLMSLDSAQQERDHIKERTRWGMQNARQKGTKSGKPIGRPNVPVDFAAVRKLVEEKGLKDAQAIRVLGIKPRTYYAAKKKIAERGV